VIALPAGCQSLLFPSLPPHPPAVDAPGSGAALGLGAVRTLGPFPGSYLPVESRENGWKEMRGKSRGCWGRSQQMCRLRLYQVSLDLVSRLGPR
jgi:hypothetical protein